MKSWSVFTVLLVSFFSWSLWAAEDSWFQRIYSKGDTPLVRSFFGEGQIDGMSTLKALEVETKVDMVNGYDQLSGRRGALLHFVSFEEGIIVATRVYNFEDQDGVPLKDFSSNSEKPSLGFNIYLIGIDRCGKDPAEQYPFYNDENCVMWIQDRLTGIYGRFPVLPYVPEGKELAEPEKSRAMEISRQMEASRIAIDFYRTVPVEDLGPVIYSEVFKKAYPRALYIKSYL